MRNAPTWPDVSQTPSGATTAACLPGLPGRGRQQSATPSCLSSCVRADCSQAMSGCLCDGGSLCGPPCKQTAPCSTQAEAADNEQVACCYHVARQGSWLDKLGLQPTAATWAADGPCIATQSPPCGPSLSMTMWPMLRVTPGNWVLRPCFALLGSCGHEQHNCLWLGSQGKRSSSMGVNVELQQQPFCAEYTAQGWPHVAACLRSVRCNDG